MAGDRDDDPVGEHEVSDLKDVRVGLWGAPSAGKTTYLTALRIAALSDHVNAWRVRPANFHSAEFMTDNVGALYSDHIFPPATQVVADPYCWHFDGSVSDGLLARAANLLLRGSSRVSFRVEVLDCPGSFFHDRSDDAKEEIGRLVRHLAESHGLVYLFDPTRAGDSYQFLQGMLDRLTLEIDRAGRMSASGNLPHSLAVCITKFDDARVFERARQGNWLAYDRANHNFPVVPPQKARPFFESLAYGQGDKLVQGSLRQYFDADAIAYFATSSVGFRINPIGNTDPNDYSNVVVENGAARVLGDVRPINVLAPLVWLENSVRSRW